MLELPVSKITVNFCRRVPIPISPKYWASIKFLRSTKSAPSGAPTEPPSNEQIVYCSHHTFIFFNTILTKSQLDAEEPKLHNNKMIEKSPAASCYPHCLPCSTTNKKKCQVVSPSFFNYLHNKQIHHEIISQNKINTPNPGKNLIIS